MRTPWFSKAEVDTVPRWKPKGFDPKSGDGVDLSGCLRLKNASSLRGCTDCTGIPVLCGAWGTVCKRLSG